MKKNIQYALLINVIMAPSVSGMLHQQQPQGVAHEPLCMQMPNVSYCVEGAFCLGLGTTMAIKGMSPIPAGPICLLLSLNSTAKVYRKYQCSFSRECNYADEPAEAAVCLISAAGLLPSCQPMCASGACIAAGLYNVRNGYVKGECDGFCSCCDNTPRAQTLPVPQPLGMLAGAPNAHYIQLAGDDNV